MFLIFCERTSRLPISERNNPKTKFPKKMRAAVASYTMSKEDKKPVPRILMVEEEINAFTSRTQPAREAASGYLLSTKSHWVISSR